MTPEDPFAASPRAHRGVSGTVRAFGFRLHLPSLLLFLGCLGASIAAFAWLRAREEARARATFDHEATAVVSNLRSALERPLEILEATGSFFEASRQVSRTEFASFVKPALERHPGVRALEWIPIVPAAERARHEAAARADGLVGFEFRERASDGAMISAGKRSEYLPIFYMEPGHPLVLGFDCASDTERRAIADRARSGGVTVASARIRLLDDPPSVFSVVVFRPVFDADRPRSPAAVRGFACEVFRVRAVAEPAIQESLRRGIDVVLLDPGALPDKRVLFESSPGIATRTPEHVFETPLSYADREWRLVLSAAASRRADLASAPWLALFAGTAGGALAALALSTLRVIRRLRSQVRAAQRLGQYTLLEKIGQGGAGVVHKARHAMLRRPTAIKFLSEASDDARGIERFEREVQLTSELTHPNTVVIYDFGRTPAGVFYYVMEYIDGIDLDQLVKRAGPLPAARVVHLLKQVCAALTEAHDIGLIHRDIKPANLMVCRRGGIPDFVKLMDFGLVKDLGGTPHGHSVTRSAAATIVGTPLFMAPESISSPREVDRRADIYALGAVAYYLLTALPVFTAESVIEVYTHHLYSEPVPPSERTTQSVPEGLERIVLRCLAKAPASRFESARALARELTELDDVEDWTDEQARSWWDLHEDSARGA